MHSQETILLNSNTPPQGFVPKDVHPTDLPTRGRLDQYEYYFNFYVDKYGDKTTVLYQCGGFYEFYGVDNDQVKIGCVKEMCALLPMRMTCQDKNKPNRNTRQNYLLAGFPTVAINKFVDFLIDHNYVVVVVDQIGTSSDKTNPSDKLPHIVSQIYSPGTYVAPDSLLDEQDHKYLVQIFLQGYPLKPTGLLSNSNKSPSLSSSKPDTTKKGTYQPMSVGLSAIDVTTGESDFAEVTNSPEDANFGLDEIYRYLQTHQPKEVLISSQELNMSPEELESCLDLRYNCDLRCQINHQTVPPSYFNERVQRQFLEQLFPQRKNLDIFEYLDLEMAPTALISYLLLLQYAYEHNETLIRNLSKPVLWTGETHLLLANNTINQLDLVSQNRFKWGSVFNLINHTTTSMGKRLLKYRLLNPVRDSEEIERRYQFIDIFLENQLWQQVSGELTGILDLDRLHRRIELSLLEPSAFNLLYDSYERIQDLFQLLPAQLFPTQSPSVHPDFPKEFRAYLHYLRTTLDLEETSKYIKIDQITDNIFCPGVYPELDQLSDVIREHHRYLDVMEKMISNSIPNSNRTKKSSDLSMCNKNQTKKKITTKNKKPVNQTQGGSKLTKKLDERAGSYYFTLTCNRFRLLQKELEHQPLQFKVLDRSFTITKDTFEVLSTNRTESHHQITSPDIRQISEILIHHESQVKKRIPQIYLHFLKQLERKYSHHYNQVSRVVALADVYKSSALTSQKYHYCRPQVFPNDQSSFLRATNFRHPIIEQLKNRKTTYIPHSLQFGPAPTDLSITEQSIEDSKPKPQSTLTNDSQEQPTTLFPHHQGLLIYGSNAVGKSSIMKAVGVNLILAQAGFYVAADRFQFSPYHRVLTRIIGNDNLFKGQSSFAVEMSELRGILARADKASLVLGDEICHGTETISGVAIVTATIKRLIQTESHFLFATHLHQLPKLAPIQKFEQSQQLGIYHLRVKYDAATHQLQYYRDLQTGSGDPIYGIEVARAMDLDPNFIKDAHQIRQTLMDQSDQLVPWDHPSRYNRRLLLDQCGVCRKEKATDTHHIRFQSEADEQGFIGHMHKNQLCNLVGLCETCHQKVHHGTLEIRGYLETTDGVKLDFTFNQTSPQKLSPKKTKIVKITTKKQSPSRKNVF